MFYRFIEDARCRGDSVSESGYIFALYESNPMICCITDAINCDATELKQEVHLMSLHKCHMSPTGPGYNSCFCVSGNY